MHEYLIIKKEECEACGGKITQYKTPDYCVVCEGRGYETPFVPLEEALDEILRQPGAFAPKKLKGKK